MNYIGGFLIVKGLSKSFMLLTFMFYYFCLENGFIFITNYK